MKRLVIILTIIISSVVAFADASFDKTINYQFNNAEAYIGEILYLVLDIVRLLWYDTVEK